MPYGLNSVYLNAVDNAGNSRSASWSFSIINTPPSFSNAAPTNVIRSASITISVHVSDRNSSLVSSSVKMSLTNDSNTIKVAPKFTYDYNSYTGQYDNKNGTITYNSQNLKDGTYSVNVEVTNEAGMTGSYTWSFTIIVPPVINNLIPAPDSKVNMVSEISANVFDSNGDIDISSIQLKVNNEAVQIEYNSQAGKIKVLNLDQVTFLDGRNNLVLTVSDAAANTASSSWNFVFDTSPPNFSNYIPNQAIDVGNPEIKVDIEDSGNIVGSSVKLWIGSDIQNARFSYRQYYDSSWQLRTDYTKGTLRFTPVALANGNNQIKVEAGDEAGNHSVFKWEFAVAAPPVVLEISPAVNGAVAVRRPIVDIDLYSNELIQESGVLLTINGKQENVSLVTLGDNHYRITFQSATDWPNDSTILMNLTVRNFSGLDVFKAWNYYINVSGEMSGTNHDVGTCGLCHNGVQIKEKLCGNCHSSSIQSWQSECFSCHLTTDPPIVHHKFSVYPHNILSSHELTPVQMGGCNTCHSKYLTREHNRNEYTCGTCHNHVSELIQTAIQTGRRECLTCHTGEDVGLVHSDHKVSIGPKCQECHSDSMMTETKRHNQDCASCHSASSPRVVAAIEWQKDSCFDCHDKPHGVQMTQLPKDIPLYSDVIWGTPQSATIWDGEGWLPPELNNSMGRILLSSRLDLDLNFVYAFYQDSMQTLGWLPSNQTVNETANYFEQRFIKGRRHCVIWFYKGDIPNTQGESPIGARLMIGYH